MVASGQVLVSENRDIVVKIRQANWVTWSKAAFLRGLSVGSSESAQWDWDPHAQSGKELIESCFTGFFPLLLFSSLPLLCLLDDLSNKHSAIKSLSQNLLLEEPKLRF